MLHKILHIAPFNTSGVPITLVRAERKLGFESRLVTFGRDDRGYEEDICLNLPLLDSPFIRFTKKLVSHPDKLNVTNHAASKSGKIPIIWKPNGVGERVLFSGRERLWQGRIHKLFRDIDFWNFDVYQLEGGLEFFRDGRTVRKLKQLGKKIICLYTGSDLRTRGVIPAIDSLSDVNLTLEHDHLALHPNLHHVMFPFELEKYATQSKYTANGMIKIGHAPTNRLAKGSDKIIAVVESLAAEKPVKLDLIENVSHEESLRRKAECDIFIDQIGDLGYGLNSLETLAMGIPTCSCLVAGFEEKYPDHPFVVINQENLKSQLLRLIESPDLRSELGSKGREWVCKFHGSTEVAQKIHVLAGLTKTSNLQPV